MNWFKRASRYADGLSSQAMEPPAESPPKASIPLADEVPSLSPARLLAASLTDCETRGEWTRQYEAIPYGGKTVYRNETRDITVSRNWSAIGYSYHSALSTPFALSMAEEKIVNEATKAFDNRERLEREAEALNRLTAPKKGRKPA